MQEVYTRYVVQGYERAAEEGSIFYGVCRVEVFATNEEEAIGKAQKLVKKNSYRVIEVGEYYYDARIDGYKG